MTKANYVSQDDATVYIYDQRSHSLECGGG